jgi:hypothetical protein
MAEHALLSPSSASRWLACTPSARLEATFPDRTSTAAEEGTLAHAFCELALKFKTKAITKVAFKRAEEKLLKHPLYDPEMIALADDYSTYALEIFNGFRAKDKAAKIYIEQRLDMTEYVPYGFGTGDTVIVGAKRLALVDYKHGKGVPVSAVDNSQLKLYGLGAVSAFQMSHDIEEVELHIYQPRIDNISSYTIGAAELAIWADEIVMPKAKLAYEGLGEYRPGEHCRFCSAAGSCRALAEENLKLAAYEFRDPPVLSLTEIADVLDRADGFTKWLNAVQAYSLSQALSGVKIPGYKLVEGRSNRKITDEAKLAIELAANGHAEKEYLVTKLAPITALEKLLGKQDFQTIVGPFTAKAPGAPTLVPTYDKRPEINSAEAAAADFANIETDL